MHTASGNSRYYLYNRGFNAVKWNTFQVPHCELPPLKLLQPVDHSVGKPHPLNARWIAHYYSIGRDIACDDGKTLIFLRNHFDLPALTIAMLYESRWQVEQFFKWIKQHLRIEHFYGTSENTTRTQIWIAASVYVLVAIVKKQLNLDVSLYTVLQI